MIRGRAGRLILALLAIAWIAPPARAQLSENLGALTGDNAKHYLQPISKALSGTLNSAVFQSGNVPKNSFNLSLGVRVMGVSLSNADKTYSPTPPPGFTPTQQVLAPTVIGSTQAVAQSGQGGTTLYHPGGFDLTQFTVAVPQLTVGSLFGTRAIVRWISVELGDSDLGKLDYVGAGAQHSISQYFPGLPADVAAGFFVQQFKLGSDLVKTNMWAANVTASKRVGIFEPYVGVGYDSFKMDASYTSSTVPGQNISVSFDRETNAHFTIGAQALLGFTRIQAEFNAAAETGAAVGLSLGRF
jgi:hypothetical protein